MSHEKNFIAGVMSSEASRAAEAFIDHKKNHPADPNKPLTGIAARMQDPEGWLRKAAAAWNLLKKPTSPSVN
jgi:hypothetical protein